MVGLYTHIVGGFITPSLHIKVYALGKCHIAEEGLFPIHIRISIRVYLIACIVYHLLGVLSRASRVTGQKGFVVKLHPSSPVYEVREVHRYVKRLFIGNPYFSLFAVLPVFGFYYHYPIGTARTVDSSS